MINGKNPALEMSLGNIRMPGKMRSFYKLANIKKWSYKKEFGEKNDIRFLSGNAGGQKAMEKVLSKF